MPKLCNRSPEQEAYLKGHLEGFTRARKDNRLERFKNDLFEGWFKSWPEEVEVFGSAWKKGDPMAREDMRLLGAAIEKRKEQLYNYVRWHASGKVVRSRSSGILERFIGKEKKSGKRSRKSHKLELYSQKYYETHFKDQVDQEISDTAPLNESKKDFKKRKMTIYRKWRSLAWQLESDEVKAKIEAQWKAENGVNDDSGDDKDADGDSDPDQAEHLRTDGYGGSIDKLGELLTTFLRELQDETGWAFTILGGGLNQEGEVQVVTSHVGKTSAGSTFPQVCDKYQANILQEFLAFIRVRHPIEERLLCAQVNNEQKLNTSSQANDTTRADVNNQPEEHETSRQHSKASKGATSADKENSGPPTTKGRKKGRNRDSADIVLGKPASGAMPQRGNVDSHSSKLAMDPSPLSRSNAVPVLSQNNSLQSTLLSIPQANTTLVTTQTPSSGYWTSTHDAASTVAFGYPAPTTSSTTFLPGTTGWGSYTPDPSFTTPIMQNVSLPYDDLSPMSQFLAWATTSDDIYSDASSTDPSLILYDTTNTASTAIAPEAITSTLASVGLANYLNPHLSSGAITPIPNSVLPPNDANSRFYLSLGPTLLRNDPGSYMVSNESANAATDTNTASTILPLPSELENEPAEIGAKSGDEAAAPAKSRKRT